jgi:hypothetical protein
MSNNTKRLLAVERVLSVESAKALENFLTLNPRQRGAHWADVLDILDDSDSNLEVTEPLWDALGERFDGEQRRYINLVALTLFYANKLAPTPAEVEAAIATILVSEGE